MRLGWMLIPRGPRPPTRVAGRYSGRHGSRTDGGRRPLTSVARKALIDYELVTPLTPVGVLPFRSPGSGQLRGVMQAVTTYGPAL